MKIIIRQEKESDYQNTEFVVEEAFKNAELSDNTEQLLVHRLRECNTFVPELSLVAENKEGIVGHVLFTRIWIEGYQKWESLALAPVSVLPEYQKQGIGSQLIRKGLKKATELGFQSVIVLGHKDYYPKFGFKKASNWQIKCPFKVPDEVFMAIDLTGNSLDGKAGVVCYPPEFGIV